MVSQNQGASSIHYDVGSAFYNAILCKPLDTAEDLNDAETEFYEAISDALVESDDLSQYIPVLPKQLIGLLEEINKTNTDFDKICDIVEGDIALAGETVRLANSPLYRRSSGTIDSIGRAIACIGIQEVTKIASALLIRQVIDINSDRFKLFGKVLWNHSLECGEACRLLSNDEVDPFTSYLTGLIHDVGKVAIFTCICRYLGDEATEGINEARLFKLVLGENSTWLSTQIASEWNLAPEITLALHEFDSMTVNCYMEDDSRDRSPLALLLVKANTCSEIYTLIDNDMITREDAVKLFRGMGLDKKGLNSILERYDLLSIGADLSA